VAVAARAAVSVSAGSAAATGSSAGRERRARAEPGSSSSCSAGATTTRASQPAQNSSLPRLRSSGVVQRGHVTDDIPHPSRSMRDIAFMSVRRRVAVGSMRPRSENVVRGGDWDERNVAVTLAKTTGVPV
jgi:hypothetical protein